MVDINKHLEKLKQYQEDYKDFVETELDKKMVAKYFELGLRAKVFKDNMGNELKPNADLWFGFQYGKYVHMIHRFPARKEERMSQENSNVMEFFDGFMKDRLQGEKEEFKGLKL